MRAANPNMGQADTYVALLFVPLHRSLKSWRLYSPLWRGSNNRSPCSRMFAPTLHVSGFRQLPVFVHFRHFLPALCSFADVWWICLIYPNRLTKLVVTLQFLARPFVFTVAPLCKIARRFSLPRREASNPCSDDGTPSSGSSGPSMFHRVLLTNSQVVFTRHLISWQGLLVHRSDSRIMHAGSLSRGEWRPTRAQTTAHPAAAPRGPLCSSASRHFALRTARRTRPRPRAHSPRSSRPPTRARERREGRAVRGQAGKRTGERAKEGTSRECLRGPQISQHSSRKVGNA